MYSLVYLSRFCVVLFSVFSSSTSSINNETECTNPIAFGIHYHINTILQIFTHPEYRHNVYISELLSKLKHSQISSLGYVPPMANRMPFVVIDGFYTAGRSSVAKKVAKAIGAMYIVSPPKRLNRLRKYFSTTNLRKHFYALSKYVTSNIVMSQLYYFPIVLERYWHDHAAYEIAAHYEPLPPDGSSIYNFPTDLARPDIFFFLNGALSPLKNNASTVKTHQNLPFGKKLVDVYRKMRNPSVVEIGPGMLPDVMAKIVLNHIDVMVKQYFPRLRRITYTNF